MATNEHSGTDKQTPPALRVVETPPAIVLAYDETQVDDGRHETGIEKLVQKIHDLYQTNMSAPNAYQYDRNRADKRRTMATLIFSELGLINQAVTTDVFETAYEESEAAVMAPDTSRHDMTDMVDRHYEHPAIQTTLRLREVQRSGPLADDAVVVQRAAALLIEQAAAEQS